MSNQNFIFSPFEQGTFLPSTSFTRSPFTTRTPDSTIVIVGGGLAGLSSAIELVDLLYYDFESILKSFSTNFASQSYRELLDVVKALPLNPIQRLLEENDNLFNIISRLSDFKIFILEKEEKVGGNSMKASSGINAVNTEQQRNWFLHQRKSNPSDVKKHPQLYEDSLNSFVYDTTKSSISPEPPIWEPLHTSHSTLNDISKLLQPLSPYTPALIKQVTKDSKNAIPFLERRQILIYVEELLQILFDKYYPNQSLAELPVSRSNRHTLTPPKYFELFLTKLSQLGGHQHPRTHRPGPIQLGQPIIGPELPIGAASISSLSTRLLTFPYNLHIQVITSVEFTGLTYAQGDPNKNVNGVIYKVLEKYDGKFNSQHHSLPAQIGQNFILSADSVILATGGYSASAELLQKYAPHIAELGLPTTNGPWATGDAINIALSAGGSVVGMDMVQIHPTSFVVPTDPHNKVNFLAPEALRGVGGILVNLQGDRFVNELTTRDVTARNIYWQPNNISFLILSQEVGAEFGGSINFYASKGIVAKTTLFNDPEKYQDVITAQLDQVLGPEFSQGSELIQAINTMITTKGTLAQQNSTKIVLFGVETAQITLKIINVTVAMFKLTKTLYSKDVYSYIDEFLPLLNNSFNSLTSYSTYVDTKDDPFLRSYINKPTTFNFSSQFYFISMITPAIHFTMGGLAINTEGQVLRETFFDQIKQNWTQSIASLPLTDTTQTADNLIAHFIEKPVSDVVTTAEKSIALEKRIVGNLYAVGEASGGLHGRNRLGGNSLLECVSMGRHIATVVYEKVMGGQ